MAQVRYKIDTGDEIIEFEAEEGLTDAQITTMADDIIANAQPGVTYEPSIMDRPTSEVNIAGEAGQDQEPQLESSAGGTFLRALPKEATFNLADEFSARANALIPGAAALDNWLGMTNNQKSVWGDEGLNYDQVVAGNMADTSAQARADAEQHPYMDAAGRITGVLSTWPRAVGAAVPRFTQALPRVAETIGAFAKSHPILTGMGAGGVTGAAGGFGAGEGDTRGQSAAIGGLAGTFFGGLTSGAMQLAPHVAHYWNILKNKMPEEAAVKQIIKALKRDGFDIVSPSGVQKLKDVLQSFTGKPVSLADIGGATRARTGHALRAPSEAQQPAIEALQRRTSGQGGRIMQDVRGNVAPRTDVHALDEELVAEREEAAKIGRERALFEDAPTPLPPPKSQVVPTGQVAEEAPNAGLMRQMGQETPDNPTFIRETGPDTLYRGGAPHDPNFQGPSFFTPDRAAAETYASEHTMRFGTPGSVHEANVAIQNPAPLEIIQQEAKRLGIDTNLTPASMFDQAVQGGDVNALVAALKKRGFDGAILDDIPMGGSGPPMKAHIPFDMGQVKAGGMGRQSRMVYDPQLDWLARLPLAQKALTKALDLAESERARLAALGQSIDHLPDLTRGGSLDMRTYDYLKRYLDQEVTRAFRGQSDTFTMAQASEVKAIRDSLRERLKEVVPEYGDYLRRYGDESEMIKSLEEGRKYTELDPEQIVAGQAKRSEAGQEFYRVGAARDMQDSLRSTRGNAYPANRIMNDDIANDQVKALGLTDPEFANLNRSVTQERQLNLLSDELRGSGTQQRLAAAEDADAGANMALPFNVGSPTGWFGAGVRNLTQRASVNRNAAVNEQILPRLTFTDPNSIDTVINELVAQGRVAEAAALKRQAQERAIAGVGGVHIGGMVALPGEQ